MSLLNMIMWLLGASIAAYWGHRLGGQRKVIVAVVQLVLGILVLTVLTSVTVLVVTMYTFQHVPGEDPVVGLFPLAQAIFFAMVALPVFLMVGTAGLVRCRLASKQASVQEEGPHAREKRESAGSKSGIDERVGK